MNKSFVLIGIFVALSLGIVAGCGTKTVSLDKVSLENKNTKEKNKSEETAPWDGDEGSLDGKIDESNINGLGQMEERKPFKEKSNPFVNPNAKNNLQKDAHAKFISSEGLNDVYFDFDRYNIDDSENKTLITNAEWLKQNPSIKVQLAGHCDERGTNNYNISLGQKRASFVKRQLVFLGISKNRLFPISFGEEKPACLEAKEKCWSKNRRVQFLISSN